MDFVKILNIRVSGSNGGGGTNITKSGLFSAQLCKYGIYLRHPRSWNIMRQLLKVALVIILINNVWCKATLVTKRCQNLLQHLHYPSLSSLWRNLMRYDVVLCERIQYFRKAWYILSLILYFVFYQIYSVCCLTMTNTHFTYSELMVFYVHVRFVERKVEK